MSPALEALAGAFQQCRADDIRKLSISLLIHCGFDAVFATDSHHSLVEWLRANTQMHFSMLIGRLV